jgi:Rps23 Pro-64 3,4-dihydroxylase Tpa1-like proline 4-hydroxylase
MDCPIELEYNRVYVEHNFLPLSLIRKIKEYSLNNKPSGLNLTDWDVGVIATSGTIILYNLPDIIKLEIKAYLSTKIVLLETKTIDATYTLGSRYSYIPWHADEGRLLACTVYLNESWDKDWSGALIYTSDGEHKAIYPEFNKAVFFKPPINHCTIMPNIQAPLRESLQIFIDEK